MITHQQKKMGTDALLQFRDRFKVPLSDEQVENLELIKLDEDAPE
jgi:pyruvate dehydrogenase E1 component